MKKYILLFLVLTSVSSAQFPMVAAWQSSAEWTPLAIGDSVKLLSVAADVKDSTGKASGDTTYLWLNRARFNPYSLGNLYQLTSAAKPIYHDSAYSQITFDGTDDAIRALGFLLPQPTTIVLIYRSYKPQGGNLFHFDEHTSTAGRQFMYNGSSGAPKIAAATELAAHLAQNADTTYMVIARFNGASSSVTVNGIIRSGNAGTNGLVGLTVGSRRFGEAPLAQKMRVHEVCVIHGLLSAGDETLYKLRATTKYGVQFP